jgi:hypothetical protein
MMRVDKVSKGRNKQFAAGGGNRSMLGQGDRTRTSYPAGPQRPGQTSGQAASGKPVRRPDVKRIVKAPVDVAGDSGGSPGASQPRRPAA